MRRSAAVDCIEKVRSNALRGARAQGIPIDDDARMNSICQANLTKAQGNHRRERRKNFPHP
jgi:hypothetical protein